MCTFLSVICKWISLPTSLLAAIEFGCGKKSLLRSFFFRWLSVMSVFVCLSFLSSFSLFNPVTFLLLFWMFWSHVVFLPCDIYMFCFFLSPVLSSMIDWFFFPFLLYFFCAFLSFLSFFLFLSVFFSSFLSWLCEWVELILICRLIYCGADGELYFFYVFFFWYCLCRPDVTFVVDCMGVKNQLSIYLLATCLSACLCVFLSVCLSFCFLFVCLFVCLFVSLLVGWLVCLFLPFCLFCFSFRLSVFLPLLLLWFIFCVSLWCYLYYFFLSCVL